MTIAQEYEEQLWARAVEEFRLAGSRPDLDSTSVVVWTRAEISDQLRTAIRESFRTQSGSDTMSLQFMVRPDLDRDLAVGLSPTRRVEGGVVAVPVWDSQSHVLAVISEGREQHYLIVPSHSWQVLGRVSPTDPTVRTGAALLPSRWDAVPRGALLSYRFHGGRLVLVRSHDRVTDAPGVDKVEITVGGRLLAPGEESTLSAGEAIELSYAVAHGVAGVRLEFNHWRSVDLADGLVARPESDRTIDIAEQGQPVVTVRPPESGTPIRLRDFPVPSSDGERHPLTARVLTCEGVDSDGTRVHVKIYRCVTSAHARFLRQILTEQARLTGVIAALSTVPAMVRVRIAEIGVAQQEQGATRIVRSTGDRPHRASPTADDELLTSWFGIDTGPGLDCYIVALSPYLTPIEFPAVRENQAPVVDQLVYLKPLAQGLDACHGLGIAHGDITVRHLCRRGGQDLSYILVDGDSVARTDADVSTVRTSLKYAAPSLLARMYDKSGTDPRLLRTSDRFAFALVVVAAVADLERLARLIGRRPDEFGVVDRPGAAAAVIGEFWDPEWAMFADVLARGLDEHRLSADDHLLAEWIQRLIDAKPIALENVSPRDEPSKLVYRAQLERIHADARNRHKSEVDEVVAAGLTREYRELAARAYWGYLSIWLGILVVVTGLALVFVERMAL
ncbi:hypothetical protein AB0L82_36310 [Nocardia sp. NPDC052001]|uniref:hypothetical protein n=1 Tax=Nocardia sp. NPDC052001 TaxID=3154853 RepID=UPI003418808E